MIKQKKPKLTWTEKKILKINKKTALMYGVVPTNALDSIQEEDFIKAEESPEAKAELEDKLMSIYTIVPTKEQADEFIRKHIIMRHRHHYVQWCDIHNQKVDTLASINKYIMTVVDMSLPENRYTIIDIHYTYEDLGIILRMSAGCAPIGCSFDNPVELESFLAREAFRKANESTKKEVKDSKKTDKSPAKRGRGRPKKASSEASIKEEKK